MLSKFSNLYMILYSVRNFNLVKYSHIALCLTIPVEYRFIIVSTILIKPNEMQMFIIFYITFS